MITAGLPMRAMSTTGSQIGSPKTTIVALVTATPMNANAVMVVGRPSAWPSICERCARGVAREVRDVQAERGPVADARGERRGEERPEAALFRPAAAATRRAMCRARPLRARPAEQHQPAEQQQRRGPALELLDPSVPRTMIATWTSQNSANEIQMLPATAPQAGHAAVSSAFSASPPIHVWMPNQPHATARAAVPARSRRARRSSRGTGRGTRCRTSSRRARSASSGRARWVAEQDGEQRLPPGHALRMSPDASVYVVMTTLMPIQSAAML
jgi:hypothetical protein